MGDDTPRLSLYWRTRRPLVNMLEEQLRDELGAAHRIAARGEGRRR